MIKIVTWNVNSVKARLMQVLDWLKTERPDIVLLQELKCTTETFPLEAFEDLGYNCAVYGQKTYNGVAVLSKTPIEDVQLGLPNFDDPQARYIQVFTGELNVASVYVPNGQSIDSEKYAYKLEFMQALDQHLRHAHQFNERFVIGGDYNVAPYPNDMHDPNVSGSDRILLTPAEQSALRAILHYGYVDALRALHPDAKTFTWWDYRGGAFQRNRGYRIDHFLLAPTAADLLISCQVDSAVRGLERASDHAPVILQLKAD